MIKYGYRLLRRKKHAKKPKLRPRRRLRRKKRYFINDVTHFSFISQ
jgi:hypothetical protein